MSTPDDRFPAFRAALRAWVFRLWDDMRAEVGNMRMMPRPQFGGGGDVLGTIPTIPDHQWPHHFDSRAFTLPEWNGVRAALTADPRLAAHRQGNVGPPGMKTPLDDIVLGFAFWPTPRMAAHWQRRLDPADVREREFDTLYAPIERFFGDDYREIVILVPLANLVVDGPCEIEPGVEVCEFSRDELQLLIDRGILRCRSGTGITVDAAERGQRHGLRRVMRVPKVIGAGITSHEGEEARRALLQPVVDRVRILRTLACCIDEAVAPQPFVARTAGWNPGGTERMSGTPIFFYSGWARTPARLTKDDHAAVRHVWEIVGDPAFEESGSLRIAVDRLAWRGTRSDDLDVLVDTAIATEAFFRSGEPQNAPRGREGTHARIARRAAAFVDGIDFSMDADDVRAFFHAAYDLRNGAVHRGERSNTVMSGLDQAMSFTEFVDRYPSLMRRALIKHLSTCDGPASPTWPECEDGVPGSA